MAGLWDFVAFVAFRKQKPNKTYLPLHIERNLVPNLRNIHIRQKIFFAKEINLSYNRDFSAFRK